MPRNVLLYLLVLGAALPASSLAQPPAPAGARPGPAAQPEAEDTRRMVSLQSLVDRVQSDPPRQFLIDYRIRPNVYVAGSDFDVITYPVLLQILSNNQLAAVTIDGIVNIVHVGDIRSQPLPIVDPDADGIAGDEWVTMVLNLRNVEAVQLVPIIRPMMPPEAHFAAKVPQTLIIVDRFANARRIVEVVRELDR